MIDFIVNNWEYIVTGLFIALLASCKMVQRYNDLYQYEDDLHTIIYIAVKTLLAVLPFAVLFLVVLVIASL